MGEQKDSCFYETRVRIGRKEWRWCSFFKARIDDVDCNNCGLRGGERIEEQFSPRTDLLLV